MPKPNKGTKIITHTKYIVFFERVYTKLAFYLAKVGDKTDEFSEADQIYREVELNHKRAMAEYEKRQQASSEKAADNLERYALLMTSWSHLM